MTRYLSLAEVLELHRRIIGDTGLELSASVDEGEREILAVAAGRRTREAFQEWVESRVIARTDDGGSSRSSG